MSAPKRRALREASDKNYKRWEHSVEHLDPVAIDNEAVVRRLVECMDNHGMLRVSIEKWVRVSGSEVWLDVKELGVAMGVTIPEEAIPGVAVGQGPGSSWAS